MTAEYVLTADFLHRLDDKGVWRELKRGTVLDDLDDDDVRRLTAAGAIVDRESYEQALAQAAAAAEAAADSDDDSEGDDPAGVDGATGTPVDEALTLTPAEDIERPKSAHSTEVWRQYAVARGIPSERAAKMSKPEIKAATR